MQPRLFVGIPTYDGRIDRRHDRVLNAIRSVYSGGTQITACSLLCFNFNTLYATALNARVDGVTHFVLLHADVIPQDREGKLWATVMLEEMEKHQLGAISAVVRIKKSDKISVAIDELPAPRNLAVSEFPPDHTRINDDNPTLLINTGCLIMDIRQPWAEKFQFTTLDYIKREGVKFVPQVEGEDYRMAKWLAVNGVRYAATSKVKTLHVGAHDYPSQ